MYHPEETMHRADLLHAGGPRRICIVSNDIPRITKGQAGQHEGSCGSRSFPRSPRRRRDWFTTTVCFELMDRRIEARFAIPFPVGRNYCTLSSKDLSPVNRANDLQPTEPLRLGDEAEDDRGGGSATVSSRKTEFQPFLSLLLLLKEQVSRTGIGALGHVRAKGIVVVKQGLSKRRGAHENGFR